MSQPGEQIPIVIFPDVHVLPDAAGDVGVGVVGVGVVGVGVVGVGVVGVGVVGVGVGDAPGQFPG